MDPIHIQSSDATAGVIAAELTRMGYSATWGESVPDSARFIVIPTAPSGPYQADRLTPDTILTAVRRVHDGRFPVLRMIPFRVEDRRPPSR